MKRMPWIIIGLLVVLALVFLLPTFGVTIPSGNISLILFILLIAGCVLPMMFMKHGGHNNHNKENQTPHDKM